MTPEKSNWKRENDVEKENSLRSDSEKWSKVEKDYRNNGVYKLGIQKKTDNFPSRSGVSFLIQPKNKKDQNGNWENNGKWNEVI